MRIAWTRKISPRDAALLMVESADSNDELYELLVAIDEEASDWGLTERLFDYFHGEMEKLAAEKDAEEAA